LARQAVRPTVTMPEGQRVIYAFTGTAGQQASVRVSASTLTSGSERVELLGPDGTSLGLTSLAL
jgi:hypothetical protein